MGTDLKRVTVTLPVDVARELEQLKRRYYDERESELLRLLLKKGMDAFREEDGNVYLYGTESKFICQNPSLPLPVEIPTEAISAPFGRFYVTAVEAELDGGVWKVRINKIVHEESLWISGYMTAENIVYFEHEGEMLVFRLDGKILRGKKPIHIGEVWLLPVVLGKKKNVVDAMDIPGIKHELNAPAGYYFNYATERLYKYENGHLTPLRGAERGLK